jgi:hypothetical protein
MCADGSPAPASERERLLRERADRLAAELDEIHRSRAWALWMWTIRLRRLPLRILARTSPQKSLK